LRLSRSERYAAGPVLRLDMMGAGESGEVVDVRGGPGMVRRLAEMGLVPGARLSVVVGAGGPGPVMVRLGGGKLGLGRGMARRVLVRPA